MKESSTYETLFAEGYAKGYAEGFLQGWALGRAAGMRTVLLRIGTQRFGPPDMKTVEAFDSLSLLSLEHLIGRILTTESWATLLV